MQHILTPRMPVLSVPDPALITCVITQGELFSLRGRLDGALAALRQIAEIADAHGLAQVQYGDGTIEEMPIHRAVAIAALEQLTGTPFRGSPDAPASSEAKPDGQPNPEPSPIPTSQPRWTPRVVSGGVAE